MIRRRSHGTVANADAAVRPYTEYLDKEMTIMGALSAFAIASVALVMNAFAGDLKTGSITLLLWEESSILVVAGGAAQLLAALFFYLQRSNLAWRYGEICLTLVPGGHPDEVTTRLAIVNADSWATWIPYRIAFVWLILGYFLYGLAIIGNVVQVDHEAVGDAQWWCGVSAWVVVVPFAGIVIWSAIEWYVLDTFKYENEPWCKAGRCLKEKLRGWFRRPDR